MNKERIEIMSNTEYTEYLEMYLESCNEMLGESMKETDNWKKQYLELKENYNAIKGELEMNKQEIELYMEYLDVSDAEEAKKKFSKYLRQK